jgi:hypothetical protein
MSYVVVVVRQRILSLGMRGDWSVQVDFVYFSGFAELLVSWY